MEKLLYAYYIEMEDNIKPSKKITMLEFLKEGYYDNVFKMLDEPEATSMSTLKGGAEAAAPVAIAAAVAVIGYKAYQRFLSSAAKSCGGLSGDAKSMCMKKYKKKALQRRIQVMKSNISKCSKSKNPSLCKSKIEDKIKRLSSKG
jgi:hypothetical protein